MSTSLVVCPGCSRHVFSSEGACPFCRAARPASGAVVALAAAALLAGGAAHADPPSPRMEMPFGGGQGYGAPPDRPWERVMPVVTPEPPAETPPVQATVTVVGGPMRVIGPRVQRALMQRMAVFGVCAAPRGGARLSVHAVVGGDGALHVVGVAGGASALRACVSERLEGLRVRGGGVAAGPVRLAVQLRAAGAGRLVR